MKSLSKFFIASMATAAMLSACSSKSATETEKVAPFVTETAQWADSATVGKSSVSVSIRAQYPAKGPSKPCKCHPRLDSRYACMLRHAHRRSA